MDADFSDSDAEYGAIDDDGEPQEDTRVWAGAGATTVEIQRSTRQHFLLVNPP